MIDYNENGAAPEGNDAVAGQRVSADAVPGNLTPAAFTWEVTMLRHPADFDRLVCPCNDGPSMCDECRAAAIRHRAVRAFRQHIAREDAVASQVERWRESEGLELDADGSLLCTTCGLHCSLAARSACATCLGGAVS